MPGACETIVVTTPFALNVVVSIIPLYIVYTGTQFNDWPMGTIQHDPARDSFDNTSAATSTTIHDW